MEDQYGPVTIWLLPFLKPAAVRHVFPDQEIGTYEEAVRTAVDHLDVDTGMRNVLVAHQFVTGAVRGESEAWIRWAYRCSLPSTMWPWAISMVPSMWDGRRCATAERR